MDNPGELSLPVSGGGLGLLVEWIKVPVYMGPTSPFVRLGCASFTHGQEVDAKELPLWSWALHLMDYAMGMVSI